MFRSYLKVALRNLIKYKVFSFIDIFGLALGITAFLLIIQYVTFENSYDSFNKNADRIYRVRNDRIYSDKHDKSAGCPPALGPTLKKEFPEVLESARLRGTDAIFINVEKNISDNLEKIYYAEPSFLKIFSFPFLSGSEQSALEEPNSIIISKSMSQKYFGNENPVNKVITLINEYGKQNYKVTGVFKDVPQNSHIKINMLISYKSLIAKNIQAEYYWGWNAFSTYILLSPNTDPNELEAKFPAMIEKYKNNGDSYKRVYLLQPLKSIHLNSNLRYEPEVNGSGETVKFLSIIALLVLILAWVNYINLSTCRSLMRAKEVGVRKVLGSNRLQLIKQFMTESFALNITAIVLAVIIDVIALPYFNQMTGKPLSANLFKNSWMLMTVMLIAGAFLSGIYPAFIMSSFNPLNVFKLKSGHMSKGLDLRKFLVIFQFTVSIILIAFTFTVFNQLSFMRNKNIGVNIDQTLILNAPIGEADTFSAATNLKDALLTLPGIKAAAISASIPGKDYSNACSGVRKFGSNPDEGTQGLFIEMDENYFKLFGVPLVAGRNFTRDSRFNKEIILNEEAVKVYGFKNPDDAINKKLVFDGFSGLIMEIVGVTKNYHQLSLKSSVQPVIFNPINASDVNLTKYFSVKIDGHNIRQTITQIKVQWDKIFPNQPFEYNFLDEIFNSQYKADQQFGEVFSLFSFLAIVISCLGLFGLASFANLRRTKEIGIRKVVGASLRNILFMLVKDFTKWVLLANLIAWPAAYYLMNKWLQDFSYRIDISWLVFVVSGGIALMIVLLTVGYHALKAAVANPVEALRYE